MAIACEKKAYMALAVTAACNVVINFKMARRGPEMAKKVVNILSGPKFTDLRLPRHLLMLLESLSETAMDKQPLTESAPGQAEAVGVAPKALSPESGSLPDSRPSRKRGNQSQGPTAKRARASEGVALPDVKVKGECDDD
jgi:hypothetical protein